jgi:hypothetical protein
MNNEPAVRYSLFIKSFLMRHIVIIILLSVTISGFGQIGGENVYEFLTLPNTARVTALGGSLITVKDDDAALALQNPAVLNEAMSGQISFSHGFYLADIDYGYVSYAQKIGKFNYFSGLQYIDYGNMPLADETGLVTGEFDAGEYALTIGMGHQYSDRISLGGSIKAITSRFETYNSYGLAADLGATYQDTASRLVIGFVIKNLGSQLTTYTGDNFEALPFDVQLGISKRLKYMPFRYTFTFHNLHRWNITYSDPALDQAQVLFGEGAPEETPVEDFIDNLFRHVIFSGEFLIGRKQNLRLRFSYNHLRRRELMVSNTIGMMGFGLGFGIKVNRFRIDYGRGIYHLAGNNNHFTISTNLAEFKKK